MLSQNLFRNNPESPTATSALLKQFQIASDVANNILDDDDDDAEDTTDYFLPMGAWRTPTQLSGTKRKGSSGSGGEEVNEVRDELATAIQFCGGSKTTTSSNLLMARHHNHHLQQHLCDDN